MTFTQPDETLSAEEKVERGASLLDQAKPNWASLINVEELNMATGDKCILGQLYGTYFHAVDHVLEITWPSDYGFNIYNCGTYVELQDLWIQEIEKRRNAA